MGDQGLERQAAEKDADCCTHFDQPAIDVETSVAQREPGQQGQHRVTGEREWQAFVHESL